MQWWSEKNILHIKSGIWKLKKNNLILTLKLNQNNLWVRVDHATRIHLLRSHQMTTKIDHNETKIIMTMMI